MTAAGAPARAEAAAPPPAAAEASFRPALLLMCGQGLAFAGTFFIPVLLARVFDAGGFGTYKQVFLVFTTLYSMAPFGMAESLFYFLPGRGAEAGRYVCNSLLFLAAAGAALWGGLWAGRGALGAWLSNPELPRYIGMLGAFLALSMASSLLEVVLTARKRYRLAAVWYGASDLLRAGFLVVPALATGRLAWVFAGAVGFAALRLAAALLVLARELGGSLRPHLPTLAEQLAYAVPFGAAVLVHVVQNTFHQYAVSYAFDAATFALYSVGCLSIPLVDFVAGPAGNVMMVAMADARRAGREAAAQALWHATVRRLALLFVPLTGLLLVEAQPLIVLLFTDAYAASVPIFMVWSLGTLWTALMTDGVLRVYADTRFLLLQSGLRLALNIALMPVCLRLFGLIGAVLVTVAAAWITKAVCLARIGRLMGRGAAELLPWRALAGVTAATLAAALPAALLQARLHAAPIVELLAAGLVYAVVLAGAGLRLGLLSDAELRALAACGNRLRVGGRLRWSQG